MNLILEVCFPSSAPGESHGAGEGAAGEEDGVAD